MVIRDNDSVTGDTVAGDLTHHDTGDRSRLPVLTEHCPEIQIDNGVTADDDKGIVEKSAIILDPADTPC